MPLIKNTHTQYIGMNLRLPLPYKTEMEALRKLSAKHDINFHASFIQRMGDVLAAMRTELEALERKPNQHTSNGPYTEAKIQ